MKEEMKNNGTYCVSCKTNTVNENSIVRKSKQNILMFYSNWDVCGKTKATLSKSKINNTTILITFEMISLKWIKSLTNFYLLEKNLRQNSV